MSQRIKQRYLFFLFVIFCPLLASFGVQGSSMDDRLYEVEKKLSGKKPVRPIDADLIKMGGIVHLENILSKSEPYKVNNDDTPYDFGNLVRGDVILSGDINPKLEFLTASSLYYFSRQLSSGSANRESAERFGDYFIYKAYGLYKYNRYLKIMLGRFISPSGVYHETYSPASDMYDFPQMVVGQLAGGLLYNVLVDGINIHGSTKAPGGKLSYYLFSAVQSSFTGNYYGESNFYRWYFQGFPNKPFVGVRLKYSLWRNKIHLGVNYQGGKRQTNFKVYGTDINLKYNRFQIKAEYVWSKEEGVNSGTTPLALVTNLMTALNSSDAVTAQIVQGQMTDYSKTLIPSDKKAWYIEPTFRLTNKLILMGRYEYIDFNSPLYDGGSSKNLTTLGFVYNPYPQLRLRLHTTKINYKSNKAYGPFDQAMTDFGIASGGGNPAAAAVFSQAASNAIHGNADQLRINGINPDFWTYQLSATLSF